MVQSDCPTCWRQKNLASGTFTDYCEVISPLLPANEHFSEAHLDGGELFARSELDLDTEAKTPKPKPNPVADADCKCGTEYGFYCGSRILSPEYKNDSTSLSGRCKPDTRYFCTDDAASSQGPALIFSEDQCRSGTHCLINGQGSDFCGSPKAKTARQERELVTEFEHEVFQHRRVSREKSNATNNQVIGRGELAPANRLPDCTCGRSSGWFCGNRASKKAKKNEHRLLTGNCTAGALYHCGESNSTSPLSATLLDNPCAGGKCYQSVEVGFDTCHH